MTTLTKEQIEDVLIDVKQKSNEWVGAYICLGCVEDGFKLIYKVFTDANIDLRTAFNDLNSIEILTLTAKVCQKLGFTKEMTLNTIDCWSADVSKLLVLD